MDAFFKALERQDRTRQIAAIATDSPAGASFPAHTHSQAQLIHAISGVMVVRAADAGHWIVPTGRAVWVPVGTPHEIRMVGNVQIRTLYVAPEARLTLPADCRVIEVSTLLRELIVAACELPAGFTAGSRAERLFGLILDEVEAAVPLSLHVPMPRHPALARLCAQLIRTPSERTTLGAWARAANMNERTLARTFERETGMTPGVWCRHARLLLSLPLLAAGTSIIDVALEHGYDSPSAFSAVFRRTFGVSPSEYFRDG